VSGAAYGVITKRGRLVLRLRASSRCLTPSSLETGAMFSNLDSGKWFYEGHFSSCLQVYSFAAEGEIQLLIIVNNVTNRFCVPLVRFPHISMDI